MHMIKLVKKRDGRVVPFEKEKIVTAISKAGNVDEVTKGKIADEMHLISPTYINPIQGLKTNFLGSKNPRLHMDEVLIALSMCAATDSLAKLALDQLPKLKGCQAHSTVMLTEGDFKIFKKLGIELTNDPIYETM